MQGMEHICAGRGAPLCRMQSTSVQGEEAPVCRERSTSVQGVEPQPSGSRLSQVRDPRLELLVALLSISVPPFIAQVLRGFSLKKVPARQKKATSSWPLFAYV